MEKVIQETKRGLNISHVFKLNSNTGKQFIVSTISYQGDELVQFVNGNIHYARTKIERFISTNRKLIRKCNKDLEDVIANNLLQLKTEADSEDLMPIYEGF